MRYADVCAGISAATVAWKPLGWRTAFYSEIEKFPSAILAHHYPETPNLGDMTRFAEWPDADFDVFIGGTPCQGFSIAGLRKGLDDPRSNLALCFGLIAQRFKPRWLVWENVPGVRSANDGRDLGAFLRGLEELGYGLCWRSLDAQYAGLAQRRERLFVVGYLGDWRRAAAVLLEPEGMRWNPPPRREAGQGVAPTIESGANRSGGTRPPGTTVDTADSLVVAFGGNNTAGPIEIVTAVNAHGGPHGRLDFESETFIAHALRADGFDASEDGTGRGTPIIALQPNDPGPHNDDIAPALRGGDNGGCFGSRATVAHPYTLASRGRDGGHDLEYRQDGTANAILTPNGGRGGIGVGAIAQGWAVRRLTPVECERLMGFPDNFTCIPWRKKPAEQCPDGPRYKSLGNSIDTHTLRWIGERIELCEAVMCDLREAA